MNTIETQIEKLETELAKLKEIANKPKSYKRWRAKEGEDYYYIDNEVNTNTEDDEYTDDRLYNLGNYYKTREEAQKALDKQLSIIKVNDRIRELNEDWEPDWNNFNVAKNKIFYNYSKSIYHIVANYTCKDDLSLLYIKSEELGEQIIKEMKTELNIIFDIK